MKKDTNTILGIFAIAFVTGMIAMDIYIYIRSRNMNYSKSFGLVKYTSKNLLG